MKRLILLLTVLLFIGLGILLAAWFNPIPKQADSMGSNRSSLPKIAETIQFEDSVQGISVEIHKPIAFDNLQIFPLHSHTELDQKVYKTLSEALGNQWVVMRETGNVSELQLDNLSKHYIFIQSGDIVKGGRQDRTMQYDVIIPPLEKDIPIASFCVEAGRWSERGGENVASFSSSVNVLSSKSMKLYAKKDGDQRRVWSSVAKNQEKLSHNISEYFDSTVIVNDHASASSLQLTLENKALDSLKKAYLAHFKHLINDTEFNGLAYAINGHVFGIELFNHQKLYSELAGKIIESFIVEAVSLRDSFQEQKADPRAVLQMLDLHVNTKLAEKITDQKVNALTSFRTIDYKGVTEFITTDLETEKWLHINFLDEQDQEGMSGTNPEINGYRRQ